ncbi:ArsC/Spx/MgsR family protein [Acidocella sp.]|uniref:ArsC/Spx/MgsR family protein n=1 Tax=Acidocella sp. TaxID=50710 RepID=UPI003D029872
MDILFYEKPGCAGNARQKAALRAAGHRVTVRNLLAEPWTKARLLVFLSDLPVDEWFNMSAPTVKSGIVRPSALSRDEALDLLLAHPLLIRRPLLEVGERRCVGFNAATLLTNLGLLLPDTAPDGCVHPPSAKAS